MTLAYLRLGLAVVAIGASVACQGKTGSPDGRDYPHVAAVLSGDAPTMQDAGEATYWGGIGRRVKLTHGEWSNAAGARIRLLPEFYVTADINGDGALNAVVILEVTNAGAESGHYLAVLRKDQLETISLGTVRLGNPVKIRGLRLDGRRMIVDLTRRGAADPEGVLTEQVTENYVFENGGLVSVTDGGPTPR